MTTNRLLSLAMLLGALAPSCLVAAQETPRTMEPPGAAAERESQLAPMPPAKPEAAAEAEARRARARAQGARDSQPADPPAPEPKADDRPAPAAKGQSARKPRPQRRAVEQVLTPTPRIMGSATPAPAGPLVYGPSLETRATAAAAAATAAAAARPTYTPGLQPTNPAICTGPNCFDGNGQRVGTGIGNTAVTPQGRLCTQGLAGLQCF